MTTRRTGRNTLAYLGVEAITPPQFESHPRAPTANDYINFQIGTLWLNTAGLHMSPPVLPNTSDIYMLVAKNNYVSTWVNFVSGGGSTVDTLTGNVGGPVGPDGANNIDVQGDTNVNLTITGNPGLNLLTVTSVSGDPLASTFPTDNGTALPTAGGSLTVTTNNATNQAGSTFLFDATTPNTITLQVTDAVENTFIGLNAGDLAIGLGRDNTGFGSRALTTVTDGSRNTAVGWETLHDVTTGGNNTALGSQAAMNITTGIRNTAVGGFGPMSDLISGNRNTAVGATALDNITTGSDNIALGYDAATNLTLGDSNNIIIGNQGTTGDSGVIRIGTAATHTTNYQQGIAGVAVANALNVVVDSATGQLGTDGGSGGTTAAFMAYKPSTGFTVPSGWNVIEPGVQGGAWTEEFDDDGALFPGDGVTPLTYTAPVSGRYHFDASLSVNHAATAAAITTHLNSSNVVYIIETGIQTSGGLGVGLLNNPMINVTIPLDAGDTVTFDLMSNNFSGGGLDGWRGDFSQAPNKPAGTYYTNYISGFRVTSAGSGGGVGGTQSFQAYLPTIQAAPFSSLTNYAFGTADPSGGGSGVIIVVFDAGSNVFIGDNVMAPATYTAPEGGIYYFYYSVSIFAFGGGTLISTFRPWIEKNDGSVYLMGNVFSTGGSSGTSDLITGSTCISMNAGESISWYLTASAGPGGTTRVRNNSLVAPVDIQSQVGGYRIA